MEFRFRYVGPAGGEVEVSSLEDLRALVTDGTVEETTLLFDALTREWAPARSHAVYRFMRDEADRAGVQPGAVKDELNLGVTLSLEEAPRAPDTDEAVRELLNARARDDEPVVKSSWEREGLREPAAAAVPDPARYQTRPFAFTSPVPKIAPHPPRPVPPAARPLFRTDAPAPEREPRTFEWAAASMYDALRVDRVTAWLDEFGRHLIHSVGRRALPGTLVLAGLAGLLFVLLSTVREGSASASQAPAQASVVSVGPEVGRLMNRFASAEESGFRSMVAGVDSLRQVHQIAVVPTIWLEGRYLADAPRYPDVKDFWTRYQAFLSDVEASDTALFRAGFVRSLEEQGIGGAVLSLRLGQAMREFERSQPRRDDVYRHMEELSSAALELHALLVDRAGDITYEPALQKGVSREPVVEAVAEDTLLKDHMWTLLERIFASLEWMGGDLGGSRDHLTDRLLEGIEASAR